MANNILCLVSIKVIFTLLLFVFFLKSSCGTETSVNFPFIYAHQQVPNFVACLMVFYDKTLVYATRWFYQFIQGSINCAVVFC